MGVGDMDLAGFDLVIFDKDGTLIDFHAMWSGWMETFAARLEAASGLALAGDLYDLMGYDAVAHRTLPGGPLAASTMARMAELTVDFLAQRGLVGAQAGALVAEVWFAPDPVATARLCGDVPRLLGALQAQGLRLAVATTDDRAPTMATLAAFGLSDHFDVVLCGDDGVPVKPAPHMVLYICERLGVAPARSVVVGDSLFDMQMARSAGARAVGVLTGVTTRVVLTAAADVVLESVGDLA
jgi:phosphoglycolate phosphatase-like HAD superfamily hydrolase